MDLVRTSSHERTADGTNGCAGCRDIVDDDHPEAVERVPRRERRALGRSIQTRSALLRRP
jgi:hypothetical protein